MVAFARNDMREFFYFISSEKRELGEVLFFFFFVEAESLFIYFLNVGAVENCECSKSYVASTQKVKKFLKKHVRGFGFIVY